jgi:nudix motif 8
MLAPVPSTLIEPPARFDDDVRAAARARLAALSLRHVDGDKRAAVVVPLCHVGGRASVLFTKRTDTVGTHKGQVSFPGGRMERTDADPIACALRELEEEVGIRGGAVEVLGPFHEAVAITGVRVSPVVAFVGDVDPDRLSVQREEVEVAFALALDQLVHPSLRSTQVLGPRKAPRFAGGPHPVWGLTALILDEVLREVLALPLPPL